MSELRNLNEEQNQFESQLRANLKSDAVNNSPVNVERGIGVGTNTHTQTHTSQTYVGQTDSSQIQASEEAALDVSQTSLHNAVQISVQNYITAMQGKEITELYDILLQEVEAPLLEVVMRETAHNQSRAAQMLGLNRGTLRKKLKRYDLL